MKILRNRELYIQLLLCAAITLAGTLICVFVYPRLWLLPFMTGVLISGISLYGHCRRYEKIALLSQELDRILHGEQDIRLDDYQEGELAILQNELSKMTLRLLEQSEQLRRDKQYLADALADISHQLKTPLTSLEIINASLAQASVTDEQRRQLLHDQLSLLSRMEWLIDVLLKLSRLDAGTITFEKKNFNVQELITQAAEPFSVSLELKQLTLNTDGVTSAVLCGDKKWLAEALSNVIKNCMEHTPAGGQLTIRVKETALYTQLTVTDTGSGIPTEELSHIFERFYHGKIANKNGNGIGLALARAIITQQNGSITAENAPEGGAQFTICFYKGTA